MVNVTFRSVEFRSGREHKVDRLCDFLIEGCKDDMLVSELPQHFEAVLIVE